MKNPLIPSRTRIYLSRIAAVLFLGTIILSTNHWKTMAPGVVPVFHLVGWVCVALGVMGRTWSGSYISGHKTVNLQMLGPYSLCRNPLYLYSFFAGLGITLLTSTISMPVVFAVFYLSYYRRVILGEESKLAAHHGDAFADYCQRIPRFWPSFAHYAEPTEYTVAAKSFRKELGDVMLFIAAGGLVEFIEALRNACQLQPFASLY